MSDPDATSEWQPPVLPFVSAALPAVGGTIRTELEDFRVEEIPAYDPCGEGGHLLLTIEKRGWTTDRVARELARAAGVNQKEVGYAGQKDRHAVTTQRFSVPAHCARAVEERFDLPDVRVLDVGLHTNRLRTGHLSGNRFTIVLREVDDDALARAEAIAALLRAEGIPNAFGPQRFGRDGDTAAHGFALLASGGKGRGGRDRYKRKMFLSAAQALLYNRYLVQRFADGYMGKVLDGDVARRTDSGGMFVVEDVAEAQERFDAHAIVHAGPIFGRKTFRAAGEAAGREAAVLSEAGLTPDVFAPFGKLALGTRRANLVFVDDLAVRPHEAGLELSFALPAGSYATVLMREMTRTELR